MATKEHSTSVTAAVEDYAKAIYALETHTGEAVTNNALAERLGVTAASASNMVKKLDQLGLVEHVPYKGVRLTGSGTKVALEVLRHHRRSSSTSRRPSTCPGTGCTTRVSAR